MSWSVLTPESQEIQNVKYERYITEKLLEESHRITLIFAFWEYIHNTAGDSLIIKATCNNTEQIKELHHMFYNNTKHETYEFTCNNYIWKYNTNNSLSVSHRDIRERRLSHTNECTMHSLPSGYCEETVRTGFMGFLYVNDYNGGEITLQNQQLTDSIFRVSEIQSDYTQESMTFGVLLMPMIIVVGWMILKGWDERERYEKTSSKDDTKNNHIKYPSLYQSETTQHKSLERTKIKRSYNYIRNVFGFKQKEYTSFIPDKITEVNFETSIQKAHSWNTSFIFKGNRLFDIIRREHSLCGLFFHASAIYPRNIRFLMIWFHIISTAFFTLCMMLICVYYQLSDPDTQLYSVIGSSFVSGICISFAKTFIWNMCAKTPLHEIEDPQRDETNVHATSNLHDEKSSSQAPQDTCIMTYYESLYQVVETLFNTCSEKEVLDILNATIYRIRNYYEPHIQKAASVLLRMNSRGEPLPFRWYQYFIYSNNKDHLVNEVETSCHDATKLAYEISLLNIQNQNSEDCKNILLLQNFIISQFSGFKQRIMQNELLQFEHSSQDIIDTNTWYLSWILIIFTISTMTILSTLFIWYNKDHTDFLQLYNSTFKYTFLYEVTCIEVSQCYLLHIECVKSCSKQLRHIYSVLESVTLRTSDAYSPSCPPENEELDESMRLFDKFKSRIHKHLIGASRASYLADLYDLPSAQVLRSLSDLDIIDCRKHNNYFHNLYTRLFLRVPSWMGNIDKDIGIFTIEVLHIFQMNCMLFTLYWFRNRFLIVLGAFLFGWVFMGMNFSYDPFKNRSHNSDFSYSIKPIPYLMNTCKKALSSWISGVRKLHCNQRIQAHIVWRNMNKPVFQQTRILSPDEHTSSLQWITMIHNENSIENNEKIRESQYRINNVLFGWLENNRNGYGRNIKHKSHLRYRYGFESETGGSETFVQLPRPKPIVNFPDESTSSDSYKSDITMWESYSSPYTSSYSDSYSDSYSGSYTSSYSGSYTSSYSGSYTSSYSDSYRTTESSSPGSMFIESEASLSHKCIYHKERSNTELSTTDSDNSTIGHSTIGQYSSSYSPFSLQTTHAVCNNTKMNC